MNKLLAALFVLLMVAPSWALEKKLTGTVTYTVSAPDLNYDGKPSLTLSDMTLKIKCADSATTTVNEDGGDALTEVGNGTYSIAADDAVASTAEDTCVAWLEGQGTHAGLIGYAPIKFKAVANIESDTKADTASILDDTGTSGVLLAATATSAQLVTDFWDRVLSRANHNVGQSGAKMLRELGVLVAAEGAVSGTPTTTVFTTNITGYDDDFFAEQVIVAYNGAAMAGQGRVVSAYNGTTGVFTVDEAFTTALSSGDDVVVLSPHVHAITQIQAGLATSTAQTTAQDDLDIIAGADGVPLATSQPNYAPATNAQGVAILLDTGTTLDQKINDMQGATFNTATDSLEAIRNRGDSSWTTGGGSACFVTGTAEAASTTTTIVDTTNLTENLALSYVGMVVETSSESAVVKSFNTSTDTITLASALSAEPDSSAYCLMRSSEWEQLKKLRSIRR